MVELGALVGGGVTGCIASATLIFNLQRQQIFRMQFLIRQLVLINSAFMPRVPNRWDHCRMTSGSFFRG
jgi:hypothetical protein